MMRNRWTAAVVLAGCVLGISAAAWAQSRQMTIEGSTTVGPIADAFAEAFMKTHEDASITVKKTGSGDGAAALIDGRATVATMSRFMKDSEFAKAVENGVMPVAHVVGMDGVAVIVHPSNPISELTTEQLRQIYTGQVTNWSQLGGPNMPIVAISRDTSSGTYEVFHEKAVYKQNMAGSVEYVNSNPQAFARVKSTQGGIGYVGLGFVQAGIKAVRVNGVPANRATVASGRYPIARPLFLFTDGYPEPGSMLFDFMTFHLTERGQEIIDAKGFVPLTNY